ncbi:MAG: septal ring lytic transglycosylase RlpA family protein, partial [Leptolyngbyaceae cyanobacterium SM2_3_12]|nr:septal ring lytic transglycosylase RlpA family protein [Leptolyngbyaceae cyanobacterium SM2_3_12]
MVAYGLGETPQTFRGTASWYGPYFHGRQTATGERFNQHALTAAHKSLPFGTYLKVRNVLNDKTVVVRVNDRGPYVGERSLDLSYAAAQCLGSEYVGVIPTRQPSWGQGCPSSWRAEVDNR